MEILGKNRGFSEKIATLIGSRETVGLSRARECVYLEDINPLECKINSTLHTRREDRDAESPFLRE